MYMKFSKLSPFLPILVSFVVLLSYLYLKEYIKVDYKENQDEYGGYSYFIVIGVVIFIWQTMRHSYYKL